MEEKKKRGRPPKSIADYVPLVPFKECYPNPHDVKENRAEKTKLEQWEEDSVPCSYVRFQQPIPASENGEPVGEFRVDATNAKYKVDSIHYSPAGVIWKCRGEHNICPLADVMYARARLK